MSHGTCENNLKIMMGFHLPSTEMLLWGGGGRVREELETMEEQEVMGLGGEEQDREEVIKGTKQNSRRGVRSTCLGSHSEKVYQELLT